MTLKAVLFNFNGIIIDDQKIQAQLLQELLIQENLRIDSKEIQRLSLGRIDRHSLKEILLSQGRVVSREYLSKLINQKTQEYKKHLTTLDKLPIYPDLADFIYKLRVKDLKLAIVTGSTREEVEFVLTQTQLHSFFSVIISADDITDNQPSKPYLLSIAQLNNMYSDLNITPTNCIAIENTLYGIMDAKEAAISVVGVANSYPYHFIQRWSNWAVDRLYDLELDRLEEMLTPLPS